MANSPERQRAEALFVLNQQASRAHKAEDFKPGEPIYPWVGTYAGSTTGVVKEVNAETQYVIVVFEDGNSPHAPNPVSLRPYEIMHAGELQA